jgi:uncharacterized protein YndB with AHSA1/START domain
MSSTRIRYRVNAPRAAVYRALLDAHAVATWMVPAGMTSHVHEFDAREGGSFRISLTYDAQTGAGKTTADTDTHHGRFVKLVPNEADLLRMAGRRSPRRRSGGLQLEVRSCLKNCRTYTLERSCSRSS